MKVKEKSRQNCFSKQTSLSTPYSLVLVFKYKHAPSGFDTGRLSQGTPYYIQIMIVMCSIYVIDNVFICLNNNSTAHVNGDMLVWYVW